MKWEDYKNFLRLLFRDDPEKATKFVRKYNDDRQEDFLTDIIEEFVDIASDYQYELNDYFLPKGITIEDGEAEHTYWIDFGLPKIDLVDGKFVVTNYNYDVVTKFVELAKKAGVSDVSLGWDYWAGYE